MKTGANTGRIVLIAGFLLTTGALRSDGQEARRAEACATPEHRQFDFWIGTWNVTQSGKFAGSNEIKSVAGGCALLESWRGNSGVTGHSLNIFDATRGVWHQTWADSSGSLLVLEGRYRDGAMVLEGETPRSKGEPALRQRISWQLLPSKEVRQLWQSSADAGSTWKTEFDGLYRRAE